MTWLELALAVYSVAVTTAAVMGWAMALSAGAQLTDASNEIDRLVKEKLK